MFKYFIAINQIHLTGIKRISKLINLTKLNLSN